MPPRDKKGSVTVIIAAAGTGSRMGGVSKPLIKLCGRYAIEYSLDAFSALDEVTRIVISTRKEDVDAYRKIVSDGNYGNMVVGVTQGGKTRMESVEKAFTYAFQGVITDFVAIHDGARPLIRTQDAKKAVDLAKKYGASVCATPCPDTVKRTSASGFVTEAVSRDGLYLMATPQIFSYEIYSASLAIAKRDGFEGTDDCSIVQNAKFNVCVCDTPRDNIKLTYISDISLAEAILAARKERNDGGLL